MRFKSGATDEEVSAFLQRHRCRVLTALPSLRVYHVRLPDGLDVGQALETFTTDARVESAEPNRRLEAFASVTVVRPASTAEQESPFDRMLRLAMDRIARVRQRLAPQLQRLFPDLTLSGPRRFGSSPWAWQARVVARSSLVSASTARLLASEAVPSRSTTASSAPVPTMPMSRRIGLEEVVGVGPAAMKVFFEPIGLPTFPPVYQPPIWMPPILPPSLLLPPPTWLLPRLPSPLPLPILPLLPPPLPLLPLLPPLLPILPPLPLPILPPPFLPPPILPPPPIPEPPPILQPPPPPVSAFQYLSWINALDLPRGPHTTVIAVIDTGADMDHSLLAPHLWVNRGEVAGNGLDDDGNGYIDDVHGRDFVGSASQEDNDPEDTFGHGTHVAGIAQTVGDNTQIMVLRAGPGPSLETIDIVQAIYYAVENGADVINMSFGDSEPSPIMQAAIEEARRAGVVVVAAAGNSNSAARHYPAAHDGVIAVAAIEDGLFLQKATFSSYGTWVDLAAPGVNILSAYLNGTMATASGTSMSAPMVAGLAARLRSSNPSLSVAQVEEILAETADSVDAQNPAYAGLLGHGLINAQKAVGAAEALGTQQETPPQPAGALPAVTSGTSSASSASSDDTNQPRSRPTASAPTVPPPDVLAAVTFQHDLAFPQPNVLPDGVRQETPQEARQHLPIPEPHPAGP